MMVRPQETPKTSEEQLEENIAALMENARQQPAIAPPIAEILRILASMISNSSNPHNQQTTADQLAAALVLLKGVQERGSEVSALPEGQQGLALIEKVTEGIARRVRETRKRTPKR